MGARRLRIGSASVESGRATVLQSLPVIAVGTAVGDVVGVAEHAPEVRGDVGATVPAGLGLVTFADEFQHENHPLFSAMLIAEQDRPPLRSEANFAERAAILNIVKRLFGCSGCCSCWIV